MRPKAKWGMKVSTLLYLKFMKLKCHFDQILGFQGPKPKFKVFKVFEVRWEA